MAYRTTPVADDLDILIDKIKVLCKEGRRKVLSIFQYALSEPLPEKLHHLYNEIITDANTVIQYLNEIDERVRIGVSDHLEFDKKFEKMSFFRDVCTKIYEDLSILDKELNINFNHQRLESSMELTNGSLLELRSILSTVQPILDDATKTYDAEISRLKETHDEEMSRLEKKFRDALDEEQENFKAESKKLQDEAKQLIDEAKNALGYNKQLSLSGSFEKECDLEKQERSSSWLWGAGFSIAACIGLGIWSLSALSAASDTTDGIKPLYLFLGRITLIPFAVLSAIFCANQYTRERNVITDYAYKVAVIQAIVSFSKHLEGDETVYREYMVKAIAEIHQDPLRARHHKNVLDNDAFTKLVELVKAVRKGE